VSTTANTHEEPIQQQQANTLTEPTSRGECTEYLALYEEVETVLAQSVAEHLGISAAELRTHSKDSPFSRLGLGSKDTVKVAADIENYFIVQRGCTKKQSRQWLTPTVVFEYPTVRSLSQFLSSKMGAAFGMDMGMHGGASNLSQIPQYDTAILMKQFDKPDRYNRVVAICGIGCRLPGGGGSGNRLGELECYHFVSFQNKSFSNHEHLLLAITILCLCFVAHCSLLNMHHNRGNNAQSNEQVQ
jgi:hypothetical protein